MKLNVGFVLILWAVLRVRGSEVTVDVGCALGKVEGIVQKTISGKDVVAFFGIPFAQPPIGDLRFQDPVPAEPWMGTLVATHPPNACLQIDHTHPNNISGSEDCLYLNVFTPKAATERQLDDLLDVIVYIHGGGFQAGAANNHDPSYLLDEEDVVLVVVNYRVGIFGFLSLMDERLPGNIGLKDQTMALKWVQQNAKYFGGDSNKVTMVGCSAGGASVHAHLLSPLSRGLFHKAIITSGVALNPWMFQLHPKRTAMEISEALGCHTVDPKALIDCLRQRPAERIASQASTHYFAPVVERPSKTAFLDAEPEEVIRSGRAADVPILLAYMEDDAIFATAEILANATAVDDLEENWADRLFHMKYLGLNGEAKRYVAETIRKFYLGNDRILQNPAKFTQMHSDWAFIIGIEAAAKLHAAVNANPVYAYVFSYVSNKRYSDYFNTNGIYKGGACHGDDLYYVLRTSYLVKRDGDPAEDAMSRTMIDVWMKFIRSEVPAEWRPVQSGLPHFTYLNVSGPDPRAFKLRTKSDTSVEEFWESMKKLAAEQNVQQHDEL